MTLTEVQNLIVGIIRGAFTNKKTLDKLSTSDDGNLLYDGNEIKGGGSDITVSEAEHNAIQTKDDGIFVQDYSQDIKDLHSKVLNVKEYVTGIDDYSDTPVGHIITHMGNTAPKHYLKCDGTIYNITDYPYLAEFIKTEFGKYNYFGGDDLTTFAVPTLNDNRFLKGSTTAGIQEAAGLPNITGTFNHDWGTYSKNLGAFYPNGTVSNAGTTGGGQTDGIAAFSASRSNAIYGKSNTVTPKNTSVLYCIKYEPTYYMSNQIENLNIQGYEDYSTDEIVIGEWIDGRPIYRRVVETTFPKITTAGTHVNKTINLDFIVDTLVDINGSIYNASGKWLTVGNMTPSSNSTWFSYFGISNANTEYSSLLISTSHTAYSEQPVKVIIEYTKTTDEPNSFTPNMLSNINFGESSKPEESLTEEEINAMIEEDYNILKE